MMNGEISALHSRWSALRLWNLPDGEPSPRQAEQKAADEYNRLERQLLAIRPVSLHDMSILLRVIAETDDLDMARRRALVRIGRAMGRP